MRQDDVKFSRVSSVEDFKRQLVAAVQAMDTAETGRSIVQAKGAAWTKKRIVELIESFNPSEQGG